MDQGEREEKKSRRRIKALHGDSASSPKEIVAQRESELLDRGPATGGSTSWTEAFKTITPGDFATVHKNPCNKQGFLIGIGSGFGVGGLRWILGASPSRASNWAVGAFILGALGAHELCEYRRLVSRETVRMATVRLKQERAERQAKENAAREAEAECRRLQEQAEAERNRPWYKVW